MTDQKKRLLINTLIMTATSLCMRGIGMGFNAWLSARIGAEGVGLFQLILSVYMMAVMLAGSGMRLASTRLCAEALALGGSPRRILSSCVRVSGALGLAAAMLLYCLAGFAAGMLGDPDAVYPLRVLSVALPLIAVETSLNGYLTARRRMPVAGVFQILEMLMRVGMTFAALRVLPGGGSYAILAIAMGMTGANVLSILMTFAWCLFDLRKAPPAPPEWEIWGRIRRIALPDAAGSWVRSALSTAEQMLVPSRLSKAAPGENALATYGLIQGMAMPVLLLPVAPLQALAGLLVPEISQMRVLGHSLTIERTVRRVILIALSYSAVVALCLLLGADAIAQGLYKNPDAAPYIRMLAPLTLFLYADLMADQMLRSLDQQVFCLRLNTADCVIRVLMVLMLLPLGGAGAYILMIYISAAFNSSLSLWRVLKASKRPRA